MKERQCRKAARDKQSKGCSVLSTMLKWPTILYFSEDRGRGNELTVVERAKTGKQSTEPPPIYQK